MSASEPPARARIAEDLRALITSGQIQPGQPLPRTKELAEQWGVSRDTVNSALDLLNRDGLIVVGQGRRPTVAAGQPRRPDRRYAARLRELQAIERDIGTAQARVNTLAGRRRRLILDLHADGMPYTDIAVAIGITRTRMTQLVAASSNTAEEA